MIDTKPLVSRMVYNVAHGTMRGGGEQSLEAAIDTVTKRIKRVMRCETVSARAGQPIPAEAAGAEGERPTQVAEPPTAGAE